MYFSGGLLYELWWKKSATDVVQIFESIFADNHTPLKIQTEAGKEFLNKHFDTLMEKCLSSVSKHVQYILCPSKGQTKNISKKGDVVRIRICTVFYSWSVYSLRLHSLHLSCLQTGILWWSTFPRCMLWGKVTPIWKKNNKKFSPGLQPPSFHHVVFFSTFPSNVSLNIFIINTSSSYLKSVVQRIDFEGQREVALTDFIS